MIGDRSIEVSVAGCMLVTTMRARFPPSSDASPSAVPRPTPMAMITTSNPRFQVELARSARASAIDP